MGAEAVRMAGFSTLPINSQITIQNFPFDSMAAPA